MVQFKRKRIATHYFFACFASVLCAALVCVVFAHADERKLRIGVISGLTGAAAKWCTFQNMGMQLAQEELQQEGFSIELIIEDSQTVASKAIGVFHKLTELDRVDAIIANDFGFIIMPLLPLAEKQKRTLVSLWLPFEAYCKKAPNSFFSAASQHPRSRPAFERFFELHPEIHKVGLVVFDDPEWGKTYLAMWQDIAASRGIAVVDTFETNEWQPDYKTMLTRMLPKKPDAILFAHEPEGMIKAARQLGFTKPIVATNNLLEMIANTDSVRPDLEGVYWVDASISDEFSHKFRKRFMRAPILEAYTGYEAVRMLAKAAALNRDDLAAGMRKVAYQGVAGRIDFTQGNCVGNNAGWGLFRFVGGERVLQ